VRVLLVRLAVLRDVLWSARLRALLLSWCGNYTADWASFVAFSVYFYEKQGLTAVGVLGLVRMGSPPDLCGPHEAGIRCSVMSLATFQSTPFRPIRRLRRTARRGRGQFRAAANATTVGAGSAARRRLRASYGGAAERIDARASGRDGAVRVATEAGEQPLADHDVVR
jgi:hypothetical protein